LPIERMDIFGNANIGIYCFSNEEVALIPMGVPDAKRRVLSETLGVKACSINICGSRLNGVLVAANSNGIAVPHTIGEEELAILRAHFPRVEVIRSKRTALGNLILVNDEGAVVDPRLPSGLLRTLSRLFGVEVRRGRISGLPYVGALAVATNSGVLAHPSISEEERRLIEDSLKVPVGTGTVNFGIGFVKAGLLANTKGAVVGSATTGPELMGISRALGVG